MSRHNKDGADEGRKQNDNHDRAFLLLLMLLTSENRTKSAALRKVNQAA